MSTITRSARLLRTVRPARRYLSTGGPTPTDPTPRVGPKRSDSFVDPKNISWEVTPLFAFVGLIGAGAVGALGYKLLYDPDVQVGKGHREDPQDQPLKEALGPGKAPKLGDKK